MQAPYALLRFQRVCSFSYLHLICVSTWELGINCFVANDVGYNYLALERLNLSRNQGFVLQSTVHRITPDGDKVAKQRMSCPGTMSCL